MIQPLLGTTVEVTAAVNASPRLYAEGRAAHLTLAGALDVLRNGEVRAQRFFMPTSVLGRLAAHVGTLGVGEAVTARGRLASAGDALVFLAQDVSRLAYDRERVLLDERSQASLAGARQRVSVRGRLIADPERFTLESGRPGCNLRLSLQHDVRSAQHATQAAAFPAAPAQTPRAPAAVTPGAAQQQPSTFVLDLAVYGELAEVAGDCRKGEYVEAWGLWQRRSKAGRVYSRLEVQEFEQLHETRALFGPS